MRWLLLVCSALTGASLEELGKLPGRCQPRMLTAEFGWCNGATIFKTLDGGRSWIPLTLPDASPRGPLGAIFASSHGSLAATFVSPQSGWMTESPNQRLFWTGDGGATWQERQILAEPYSYMVCNVRFLTPTLGLALVWERTPGVYRSEDSGRTWKRQVYAPHRMIQDRRAGPGWLEFADLLHGLSIEHEGMLFTRDGGKTWQNSRYCSNVNTKVLHQAPIGSPTWSGIAAQLLDAEYGWWAMVGDLFRTTDGGATWCQLPPIRLGTREINVAELHFANRKLGWAMPDMFGIGKLPIFETRDGGQSWKPVELPGDPWIYGMSVVSESVIFVWDDTRLYRMIPN